MLGCVLLFAVFLSACAPSAPAAHSGLPRVIAAETFLADIAQNVAGDRLIVESLLPVGMDPHEFQPTPQDAIRLTQSDVIILNGAGYETWMARSVVFPSDALVITASDGVARQGDDPHMWMDVHNVQSYVANIRDGLIKADPAGASTYTANAEAYAAHLQQLDSDIHTQVSAIPADKRMIVTNHESLGYFASAYGFTISGAVLPGVGSDAAPSAKQVAALIGKIRAAAVPAIFLDVSEKTHLAQQVASETGARVVTGLYVETLSSADGPAPTYIEMMRHDVQLIVSTLR